MKLLFKVREFAWDIVSEIEDWLYPYRNRLTPEEQFEIRVKDPMSGENFMVEEHIQQQNERIERLQAICKDIAAGTEVSLEDMIWANKLAKANTSARGKIGRASCRERV